MNRNASRAFREIGVENEEACETDDRKRKRKREEEEGGKGGKRMRRGQRGRGNVGVETSGSTDFSRIFDTNEPPRTRDEARK